MGVSRLEPTPLPSLYLIGEADCRLLKIRTQPNPSLSPTFEAALHHLQSSLANLHHDDIYK